MTSLSIAISEAANQVINVRDFSGSKSREIEAASESLYESSIDYTPEIMEKVMSEADSIWRQSQYEAGVDQKYFK